MSELVFIALGSSLGNRSAYLAAARNALDLVPETHLVAATAVEETAPLGGLSQPPYLNQMVALRTSVDPYALLRRLQAIERSLGRVRAEHWRPRTIDLDIVRFGTRRIESAALTVPHPGIGSRAFWQREMAELESLS